MKVLCNWGVMGWMGWPMMVLFWIGLVVLIVWLVRSLSAGASKDRHDALDLLERRFAAGEIDLAEFEERRRALKD